MKGKEKMHLRDLEVCLEDQEFFTITYKTFPMYGCLDQIIRGLEPCSNSIWHFSGALTKINDIGEVGYQKKCH